MQSEFMMVQLFQLALCVTMTTIETTAMEMIQELILLYPSSLNYTPLHQQQQLQSDYPVWGEKLPL